MMNSSPVGYVPRRVLTVWSLLVGFTIVTWLIGTDHLFSPTTATAVVLALAFAKVRFVGSDFMELRHAPRPMGLAFDGLLLAVYIALMAMYALY